MILSFWLLRKFSWRDLNIERDTFERVEKQVKTFNVLVQGTTDLTETADEKAQTFEGHKRVHDHVGFVWVTACHHAHSAVASHAIRTSITSHAIGTSISAHSVGTSAVTSIWAAIRATTISPRRATVSTIRAAITTHRSRSRSSITRSRSKPCGTERIVCGSSGICRGINGWIRWIHWLLGGIGANKGHLWR